MGGATQTIEAVEPLRRSSSCESGAVTACKCQPAVFGPALGSYNSCVGHRDDSDIIEWMCTNAWHGMYAPCGRCNQNNLMPHVSLVTLSQGRELLTTWFLPGEGIFVTRT